MAEFHAPAALRAFALSTGETVDLIDLISSIVPQSWARARTMPEVGTIVFADAMGAYRRGVVVKTTKTKVHVALTTAGAVQKAASSGYPTQPIRVQTVVTIPEAVYVAPTPVAEPVEAEPLPYTPGTADDPAMGGPVEAEQDTRRGPAGTTGHRGRKDARRAARRLQRASRRHNRKR